MSTDVKGSSEAEQGPGWRGGAATGHKARLNPPTQVRGSVPGFKGTALAAVGGGEGGGVGWQRRAGGPGRATQARPWVPASGWTQQLPAGSSLNAINTQHLHWERAPGAWEVGVRRLPASAGMEVTLEGDWDSAGRGPLRHTAPPAKCPQRRNGTKAGE